MDEALPAVNPPYPGGMTPSLAVTRMNRLASVTAVALGDALTAGSVRR
jgi:hypothetical protein